MSIKKQYLKSKPECKVTFLIPKELGKGAQTASIVADFADWDKDAIPMKKLKTGEFKVVKNLKAGGEYQFRYLIDGKNWENDPEADKYVPNNYTFEDNSVVIV
ncbi:isoamylase early set domain-containing protein [Mangrovivirga sp. M17]|uniref:Isoamylase early set domain-containing protein n=1 Tax=Mangrovivirga halotolerans TaxID=2993936 RepID=A0ABT3RQC3_9BACT|nr:isoamylase early set domain-containing protein [Mangrovivirga halotolerans]MCX2743996.1 isoamylase early set domain-containing protein [Mangrovivirga halotolerans]